MFLLAAVAALRLPGLAVSGRIGLNYSRDNYGVPHIAASNRADGWRAMGYAVAEDRLWQMEMSRRTVRGRISEVLGAAGVASDKEVLQTAYTPEELEQQFKDLPAQDQAAFTAYADGVNDFIAAGPLPAEFAQNGIKPEPWTPIDSVAISIWLLQYFGRGGAGQLRNMAALSYLQGQAPVKGRVPDLLDDFLWQNDPSSPTTVLKEDESKDHPNFVAPSRAATLRHLAMLPKLSLFELLPGLNVASRSVSTRLAERVGAPFRTGSYCMVVGSKRSATGMPLLLSGPQMGFTVPSIVHELSIDCPDLHVVGMDVPGIPGVLVGHTDKLAWGVTSGEAATDDVTFAPRVGSGSYLFGKEERPLLRLPRTFHVKGGADQTVVQERTESGPVLLSTSSHGSVPGYVFARHCSYRMKELKSLLAIESLWTAKDVVEGIKGAAQGTMNFNVFMADKTGHIGYRFCGLIPLRSNELDPRLPVPEGPLYAWSGTIPASQMPQVVDPRGGLLTNWNNKPVSWWPNLDTPLWGRIFRVDAIRRSLPVGPLSAQDLELAAWKIARTDESWPYFAGLVGEAARLDHLEGSIGGFDGRLMEGSRQAVVYRAFLTDLRKALFGQSVGNFMSDSLAAQVAQPSVMLAALEGRTKFNFLAGRKAMDVVRGALKTACARTSGGYVSSQIHLPDEVSIPYANRGTYIQVVELLADGPLGRNVLPPGVASSGPHSRDQVPLSRAWVYKPMTRPWTP